MGGASRGVRGFLRRDHGPADRAAPESRPGWSGNARARRGDRPRVRGGGGGPPGGYGLAVDVAEAMVARAAAEHPGIEFTRADAQSLPFEDGTFDAVVANFGLPHFGRPELAVAEGVRTLVAGGRLALTTWDSPAEMRMFGVFLEAVAEAGAGPPDGLPPGPDVFRFSDDEEFRRLLEEQGLVDVEVRRVAFTHQVESFEDFWGALQRGTVRMASLILGQSEQTQEHIRAALERRLAAYGTEGRFDVPISVKLAVGRKKG